MYKWKLTFSASLIEKDVEFSKVEGWATTYEDAMNCHIGIKGFPANTEFRKQNENFYDIYLKAGEDYFLLGTLFIFKSYD